jgi:hypothetical protein
MEFEKPLFIEGQRRDDGEGFSHGIDAVYGVIFEGRPIFQIPHPEIAAIHFPPVTERQRAYARYFSVINHPS